MQTHHLSHRARGQRYMWATVTCLKVTQPDKSNLPPWREWLDWCVSHLLAMPSQRSGIDGRAAWWAVPAPYLSVCLLLQHLGIHLPDNGPKQTDVTDWKLPAGFYTKCTVDVQWFNCVLYLVKWREWFIISTWIPRDNFRYVLSSSLLYIIVHWLWWSNKLVLKKKQHLFACCIMKLTT